MSGTAPERPGGWALRGAILVGLLAVVLAGGAMGALGAGAFLLLLWRGPRLGPTGWAVAHGVVLLATGLSAAFGPPSVAFGLLVAWLLAHRSWVGRSADDVRVALLLATLLLLLGAAATESALLGPLFVAYAALLPVALLRAALQGTGEPAPRGLEAALGAGAVALGAVFFLALPRLDRAGIERAGGAARFPDEVALGEDGLLNADAAEVLRVAVTDRDGTPRTTPLHLRGRALDRFDGVRWTASETLDPQPDDGAWDARADVRLDGVAGELLFAPAGTVALEGLAYRRGPGGAFLASVPARGYRYAARVRESPLGTIDATDADRWLALPDTLDPRVRNLAWTVAGEEADPAVVARALSEWMAGRYAYVADPPPARGDPVSWFLLEAEAGHCEYFASGLVLLLRARGIPARFVTGFYSEELDDEGAIVVRRGNAHAWAEVRTTAGWAVLDPTPATARPSVDAGSLRARLDGLLATWRRGVVEYDLNAQLAAYGAVGRSLLGPEAGASEGPSGADLLGMVVVLGGLGLGLLGVRVGIHRLGAPRAGARDAGARLCAQARAAVRRRGWALPDALPMLDAAEWLERHAGADAAPFRRLAELVYAARYGGGPPLGREARACVRSLKRMPGPRAGRLTARGARG